MDFAASRRFEFPSSRKRPVAAMMDPEIRTSTRLAPETSWSVYTEGPLKGIGLAREAGLILAWDDAHRLYLYDLAGETREASRAPGKVLSGVISDDGSRVVLLGEGSRLWFLDQELQLLSEKSAPPEASSLAIDPHGRYVAVATRLGLNQFYSRHGKPAGRFDTIQALSHLVFVADKPLLIGAANHGLMMAFDLSSGRGGKIDADPIWQERQLSNVGRLAITGDGSMILASCFNHGVQRFDSNGDSDGSYHVNGTATHAVPDFAGRIIAVATLEGALILLNAGGNVRWRTELPRPAIALETDPLGRYLIHGNETGTISRLDFFGSVFPDRERESVAKGGGGGGHSSRKGQGSGTRTGSASSVRQPAWKATVASTEDQAGTTVLTVLDQPSHIAVFSNSLRLQLFTGAGENLGYAPTIQGVGRILRVTPGWIAAATDRAILTYNASKGEAQRVDASLVEVTHLSIRPESFGLGIVQERDRVGRLTIAGRWIWKRELAMPVEDIAIGAEGDLAISTDTGKLIVFDAGGQPSENFELDGGESLSLIEAVDKAPPGLAWITLARRSQVLRGHDRLGKVLWQSPVAFEAWQFMKLGKVALLAAADGRVQAFDGTGNLLEQGKASEGSKDLFAVTERGSVRRISRQGAHILCTDLQGRVTWRTVCDEPIGPMAAGTTGVAVMIGRSFSWFPGLDGPG